MDIKVLRATEEWQRAGAYSVRIQAMNRAYHISLRDEFDEHDCDDTKFIVLLDDEYPVATCRFYEIDAETATIGRVVVMPEWIAECGYKQIIIDSRLEATGFYEKLGYKLIGDQPHRWGVFECTRMTKSL